MRVKDYKKLLIRPIRKFLGKNACGSGWDFDIHIHYGAGAIFVEKKQLYWKV